MVDAEGFEAPAHCVVVAHMMPPIDGVGEELKNPSMNFFESEKFVEKHIVLRMDSMSIQQSSKSIGLLSARRGFAICTQCPLSLQGTLRSVCAAPI